MRSSGTIDLVDVKEAVARLLKTVKTSEEPPIDCENWPLIRVFLQVIAIFVDTTTRKRIEEIIKLMNATCKTK